MLGFEGDGSEGGSVSDRGDSACGFPLAMKTTGFNVSIC